MNMDPMLAHKAYAEAAAVVRSRTTLRPRIALILGSGLNPVAEQVAGAVRIPFGDVPGFARPSIEGHAGQIVCGMLAGCAVLVMQGRVHTYEGYTAQQATFPVRVMHELGVEILIVTNAAGGVNTAYRPGDLMLITDHLGLAAMSGLNPLWGPNDPSLGPRFVDMGRAYDLGLRQLAGRVAAEASLELRSGVYAWLAGPTFETPAEVRFLRAIGADAVGMSTVPEVIVARHMGMRVLGISTISNQANDRPDEDAVVDHAEVLAAGVAAGPRLLRLLSGVLSALAVP
jgi:purine-nucleoside phosphorylase